MIDKKITKVYFKYSSPLYFCFRKPPPQPSPRTQKKFDKLFNKMMKRLNENLKSSKESKSELESIQANNFDSSDDEDVSDEEDDKFIIELEQQRSQENPHFKDEIMTISIPKFGDYDPYWGKDTTEYVQKYYKKPENGGWILTSILEENEFKTHYSFEDVYEYFETPAAQTQYFRIFLPSLNLKNNTSNSSKNENYESSHISKIKNEDAIKDINWHNVD